MNQRTPLVSQHLTRRNVLRMLAGAAATVSVAAVAVEPGRLASSGQDPDWIRFRRRREVHVSKIELAIEEGGAESSLIAEVTAVSGSSRLRNATVTVEIVTPDGVGHEMNDRTNSSGVARFVYPLDEAGDYGVVVAGISRSGYSYTPANNSETEEWITYAGNGQSGDVGAPDPAPEPEPEPTPTPEPEPTSTPEPEPEPAPGGIYASNVKDYGATGNGSTDDAAAVQRAIDAVPVGGRVYFPSGEYYLASALLINRPVELIGESRDGTVLRTTATWGAVELYSDANGVTMRDLTFKDGGHTYCVRMFGARNVAISNCAFRDYGFTAISLQPAEDISITNCDFHNINWTGVRLEDIGANEANRRITIDGCNFYNQTTWSDGGNPYGHGAVAAHGWREHHAVVIRNCYVDTHGIGFALDTVFDSRVENCQITGHGQFGEGIAFSGSRNSFINNTIDNFPAAGILHWGTDYQGGQDDNLVQGNTCYDNAQGIAFVQGSWETPMRRTKITGNRCYDSGGGLTTQNFGIQSYQGWEGTPNPVYEGVEINNNDLSGNAHGAFSLMHTNGIIIEGNIT